MDCYQSLLEWRWFVLLGWGYACLAWQLSTGFNVALFLSWVLLCCSVRNEILQSPTPMGVTAGIPSNLNPASKEMISDSVELYATEVYFLHIQLIGTNVWLQTMHKTPPDVVFESLRSAAKSESWHNPNLHCCAVIPTEQYCRYSLVWWMLEIKRARRLSQALNHSVTARASLFTDHRMSGLPMRVKYRYFGTICEQTVDRSPTDSFSF